MNHKEIVFWCVNYGPDNSHLYETKVCYLRRDAIKFSKDLPDSVPFRIMRCQRKNEMSHEGKNRVVSERLI